MAMFLNVLEIARRISGGKRCGRIVALAIVVVALLAWEAWAPAACGVTASTWPGRIRSGRRSGTTTSPSPSRPRVSAPSLRFRPWLQAFGGYAFDRRPFGAAEIRAQIGAAEKFGAKGWMLWNRSQHASVRASARASQRSIALRRWRCFSRCMPAQTLSPCRLRLRSRGVGHPERGPATLDNPPGVRLTDLPAPQRWLGEQSHPEMQSSAGFRHVVDTVHR